MHRTRRSWAAWDEAAAAGVAPADFLARTSDEALIELAASGDPHRRKYELDLVIVELSNRLQRLRREIRAVRELATAHLAEVEDRIARGERLLRAASPLLPRALEEKAELLIGESRGSLRSVREALEELEEDAFAHARDGTEP